MVFIVEDLSLPRPEASNPGLCTCIVLAVAALARGIDTATYRGHCRAGCREQGACSGRSLPLCSLLPSLLFPATGTGEGRSQEQESELSGLNLEQENRVSGRLAPLHFCQSCRQGNLAAPGRSLLRAQAEGEMNKA